MYFSRKFAKEVEENRNVYKECYRALFIWFNYNTTPNNILRGKREFGIISQ